MWTSPAQLTFVKTDDREYHRVWVQPDGREATGHRLHVRHDLPHLAVESAVRLGHGLWGSLVEHGAYPGLTQDHLVAKSITNAIWGAARRGLETVSDVRGALASFQRPDRQTRDSFDAAFADRCQRAVEALLDKLDDDMVSAAAASTKELLAAWGATPVGESLRLRWPHGVAVDH